MPPIGWYLAQGLYPLGEDSSDDDDGPCELPNGKLVCGRHGRVWCGVCCVDYSFMDEINGGDDDDDEDEDDEDEDDDDQPKPEPKDPRDILVPLGFSSDVTIARGTGRVFPTEFIDPLQAARSSPLDLFSGREQRGNVTRYVHSNDRFKVLIHTDGACLANGQASPKAGWAFWHGSGPTGNRLVASSRLEPFGPFGDPSEQTSNRAELRAVIAALRYRIWYGEAFNTLVIATDSEYVVKGATDWVKKWVQNGWTTVAKKAPVKNKDLWEALLGQIERYDDHGLKVQFWRIPRQWNAVADEAAKEAAAGQDLPGWADVLGMIV